MKELEFKDFYIGIKVSNKEGDTGIVIACKDIHNINVQYDEDGSGLYCIDKNCPDDYEPLFNV